MFLFTYSKNHFFNTFWRTKCHHKITVLICLAQRLRIKYCANFIVFIKNILTDENFVKRHKKDKADFTRNRTLPFFKVVTFLCNLLRSSLQNELDRFFQALSKTDVAEREVTASAFCQARKKLKPGAFIELTHQSNDYFYKNFSVVRWHGFRILAVDGSTGRVPKNDETEAYFGVWHPAAGGTCPVARVSQMLDVLNHLTVDAKIAPKDQGERELASQHFDHLGPNDLALLDSGYPAFWVFQRIRQQQAHFCARLAVETWSKLTEAFLQSGLKETIVELKPWHEARKQCEEKGLPTTPFAIRLLRIDRDGGEVIVLATDLLDTQLYPYELFNELYRERWPVEESYKLWKTRIEIENFTGKSVEAIQQDFHARVFMSNVTAILAHPVHEQITAKHQDSKHDYKINWTQALAKMRASAIILFFRENLMPLIRQLQKLFLADNSVIRPGRKFPRKPRLNKKTYAFAYKPIS